MSDTDSSHPGHCLNCSVALASGNFCANCGQEVKEIRRPFVYLLKDGVRAVFELDGRAYRTLFYLFTRPGFLTREYVSGRRMMYTPPLRLFLVISISFFLAVSAVTLLQSINASMAEITPGDEFIVTTDAPDETDSQDGSEVLNELVDGFNIPFVGESRNENIRRFLRTRGEANLSEIRSDPSGFFFDSLDYITVFILLMMPILALVQKVLYLRSKRYYVEHLILTLHNHAFIILAVFLSSLVGLISDLGIPVIHQLAELTGLGVTLWIVTYLFLSLKNFFEQSTAITLFKYATMAIIYTVVTAIGVFYFAAVVFFVF